MSTTTLETALGVTILVIRSALFIATCRIVWREFLTRRAQQQNKELFAHRNSYQRYLAIFSFTAMLFTVLSFLFQLLQTIKELCYGGYAFVSMFYTSSKIFLTFYQLARLQYCFANNQIHSKLGYPKWWFILLYTFGVIIELYAIFASFYIFGDNWRFVKFGIFWNCIGDNIEFRNRIINPIGAAIFFVWDWTVIVCYIIKVRQFYKKKDGLHGNIDENIRNRIKFILYKITYLTFVIELIAVLASMIGPFVVSLFQDDNLYPIWIARLLIGFENYYSVYVIYMMIDHNNDEYFKLIRRLNRLGCYCCCKSFVTITLSMDQQMEKVVQNSTTKNEEENQTDLRDQEENGAINRANTFQTKTIADDIGAPIPKQQTLFSATHYE